MAWTYSDWRSQSTDSARLTRLRQHMDEVNAQIAAAVSDGGASRSTADLVSLLDRLVIEEDKLVARVNGATGRHRYIRRGLGR